MNVVSPARAGFNPFPTSHPPRTSSMAAPFAQTCRRACRWTAARRISSPCQWHSTRTFSTTPTQRKADQIQQTPDTPSDPALDHLTQQQGVTYTITEATEDLSRLNVDNLSSLAHRELEQHKELRELARIAAWEMPLLSQFARPFEPPSTEQVLRWRYTTYLGEPHPAARKVVVEFQPERLPDLNAAQRSKLLKLAGARYNPSTQTVKMSCEAFETQAQNKRFLADTIGKLVAEARDLESDDFADVPLDTRHHKPRIRHQFPRAWAMTPERRAQLEAQRRAGLLEEGERIEKKTMIDGAVLVEAAKAAGRETAKQPVLAGGNAGRRNAQR